MLTNLVTAAFAAAGALGSSVHPRQNTAANTAIIDLVVLRGSPQHLGAGFIYGMPSSAMGQSPNQIPAHFYADMGFNYARAGGGQLSQGGWVIGLSAYQARFAATKENYLTARQFGARFQLLPHDLWGTDHTNSSTHWPGDNGDWSDYDKFVNQMLSDLVANDMLDGLDIDIWNEPDGGYFWKRSFDQYYELWVRTYQKIRTNATFADALLVGPSTASQPTVNSGFWETFLSICVGNNTIPDQYTWHDEPGDPQNDVLQLYKLLATYGAPNRTININEYGSTQQQVSTGTAWFISRLERFNAIGLRGNWLDGCHLYDFMANLLGKTNDNDCAGTGYFGNGEYQVYKYYNQNMTGLRAQTTGTGDGVMDVYTTIGRDKVRTLTGVNLKQGTWYITIQNLTAVGLPTSGSLSILTYGFIDNGTYGEVDGPTYRNTVSHPYSNNAITFPVFQTAQDANTAWAFEFDVVTNLCGLSKLK